MVVQGPPPSARVGGHHDLDALIAATAKVDDDEVGRLPIRRSLGEVDVAGHRAQAFDNGEYDMLWLQGDVSVELRVSMALDGKADLEAFLPQVIEVDVDTWLEAMPAATDAGDEAATSEAVAAMGTSRDWTILDEVDDGGDWPEFIWETPMPSPLMGC